MVGERVQVAKGSPLHSLDAMVMQVPPWSRKPRRWSFKGRNRAFYALVAVVGRRRQQRELFAYCVYSALATRLLHTEYFDRSIWNLRFGLQC